MQLRVAIWTILNVAAVVSASVVVNMTKEVQTFGPLLKGVEYLLKIVTSVHTYVGSYVLLKTAGVICPQGESLICFEHKDENFTFLRDIRQMPKTTAQHVSTLFCCSYFVFHDRKVFLAKPLSIERVPDK